ncbi:MULTISPECIES: hypothetical protein [unclassified Bradyrhizobium]|uniref:hypothetical protein n=1 Tax=unclassified Bradyrhizobium TaxID=2631580 RepID=UPI0028EB16D1|nr:MULTISPECIES: hypothetical protein [unclassified Bradyrhizobium]
MTESELRAVRQVEQTPVMIGPIDGHDRTLLYGYDSDANTWHVYQANGELHRVIYIGSNPSPESHDNGPEMIPAALIPNKRLYPEACDFDFCLKLASLGVYLPFTTYGTLGDLSARGPFIGKTF